MANTAQKLLDPTRGLQLVGQSAAAASPDLGAKSARQQLLTQPTEEKWYSGSTPTNSEVLARIYTIGRNDPEQGKKLFYSYENMRKDPSSPIYNPYSTATNKAISELGALGADVSGGLDGAWFENYSWLKNHYRTETGNTPLAPTAKSTKEENAAYWYYKALAAEPTTQRAEQEWAALQEELAYWTTRSDRNYSDDEVLAKIDWSDYPTLTGMDEAAAKGTPTVLNRAIGYSQDALRGVIWAARNGGDASDPFNSVRAALGQGVAWQQDERVSAKLDPTSPDYNPYSVGSTLDDAALYFGVASFDKDWLENNRGYLSGNDETAKKYYQKVYNAEQTTLEAEAELAELWETVDNWMMYSTDPDIVLSGLLDDFTVLKSLDKSLQSGDLKATTRAIDYRWEDIEAEVRRRCELANSAKPVEKFTEEVGALLGKKPVVPEGATALQETGGAAIEAAAPTIMAHGTDEEKLAFQMAYSPNFEAYVAELDAAIANGVANPQAEYEYCLKRADEQAADSYLHALGAIRPYEATAQQITELEARAEELKASLAPAPGSNTTPYTVDGVDYTFSAATNQHGRYSLMSVIGPDGQPLTSLPENVRGAAVRWLQHLDAEAHERALSVEGRAAVEAELESTQNALAGLYAQQEAQQAAYDEAMKEMQLIDRAYANADRLRALSGLEDEAGSNLRALLDFTYEVGAEYRPTQWAAYSAFDYALEAGYGMEEVALAATASLEADKAALSTLDYVETTLSNMGITLPGDYADNLERERARLNRDIKSSEYFLLRDNDDFASTVEAMRNQIEDGIGGVGWLFTNHTGYGNLAVFAVHPDYDVPFDPGAALMNNPNSVNAKRSTEMLDMTQEERDTYLYLLAKKGETAANACYKFLTDPTYGVIGVRETLAQNQVMEQFAKDHPFAAAAFSVLTGPTRLEGTIYSLMAGILGEEINPYNESFAGTWAVNITRSESKETMLSGLEPDSTKYKLASLGYDVLTSAAESGMNSLATLPLGGIGGAFASASLLGLQAAGSAIQNAKLMGADNTQALILGGITYLAETGSEAITTKNIADAIDGGASGVKGLLKKFLAVDAVEEFFGEAATEAVEYWSEALIMEKLSAREEAIQNYIDSGMSPDEAKAAANEDFWMDVLTAGLTGALSGETNVAVSYAAGKISSITRKKQAPAPVESTEQPVIPEEDFPLMQESFGPNQLINQQEQQKKSQVSKSVTTLAAAATADEASQTAAIAAVLSAPNMSHGVSASTTAAAQHLMQDLGMGKAVQTLEDIVLTATEQGVEMEALQVALSTAALSKGAAHDALVNLGEVTPEAVNNLVSLAQQELQNPETTAQMRQTIQDNQVALHVEAAAANGALSGITSYEEALQQAKLKEQNALDALEQEQKTAQAMGESLQSLNAEFIEDPTNQATRGAVQQAIKDVEGQAKVVHEYEQSVANAQEAVHAAQNTLNTQQQTALAQVRQQAQAEVAQIEADEAMQPYNDAIAAYEPTVPAGQMVPLTLANGSTVNAIGLHSYTQGGKMMIMTDTGSVISHDAIDPWSGMEGLTKLVELKNANEEALSITPAGMIPLQQSAMIVSDNTGEMLTAIGFVPSENGALYALLTTDGQAIDSGTFQALSGMDADVLTNAWVANLDEIQDFANTQEPTQENTQEQQDGELHLKPWQDPQYHGKVKAPRKLKTDTKNFEKWFNDPSGDLTEADGHPRVIYRGTTSKLYMEHKAPSKHKTGSYLNFYSPDIPIAASYAEGSTHVFKIYDIVNWETAAAAMQAEGYVLREEQNHLGEWGYHAYGVTSGLTHMQGDFYLENELDRFNKEYGKIRRNGLYAGYMSLKNPLVIDAHGAVYDSVEATVKDKDGNDYHATKTNRAWAEWARDQGYDATIVRNVRDYLWQNGAGATPGTVIMTYDSQKFKSIYNTGKLGKKNADIRYNKAGTFALTGEPISSQMQTVLDTLALGKSVAIDDIMSTPEVMWAEEHQMPGESLPYKPGGYTEAEVAEILPAERILEHAEALDKLMGQGSAVIDKNGKVEYTGPVAQNKRLDVVIGPPSAGKSTALADPLSQAYHSRIPDSDAVKELFGEYEGGLNSGYLHNESRYVWEQMKYESIANGDNVVLPIVGHKLSSVMKDIADFQAEGYHVHLHYLELDGNKTLGRALNRFLEKGRYIEPGYLMMVSDGRINDVYNELKGADFIESYSHWNNDVPRGQKPQLLEASDPNLAADLDGRVAPESGKSESGDRKVPPPENGAGGTGEKANAPVIQASKASTQQQPSASSMPSGDVKKLTSPQRIAKDLAQKLHIGDYIGTRKMNNLPQAVLGYYQTRANYIGVRNTQAGNYVTTMHEMGHALAKITGMTGTADMVAALDPVFASSYSAAELPGEAFAEFFWRYAADENTARQFAGDAFVDEFQQKMRQKKVARDVQKAADQLRAWIAANVDEKIGSTIRSHANAPKLPFSQQFRQVIDGLVDSTAAAEAVNKKIRQESGSKQIDFNMDIRANALMNNYANRRAYSILTDNLTDSNGNILRNSLAEVLADAGLTAKDEQTFERYMLALHSLDRDAQGKAVFDNHISHAERVKFIQDVQTNHPNVAAAEQAFQQWRKDFMQAWMVDTGRLDQSVFDMLNKIYPHYVPTRRVKDPRYVDQNRTGGRNYQIRAATGSTEDIWSPLESFVDMVQSIVSMDGTNKAALAWDNAYQAYELGEFGRDITPDMERTAVDTTELQEAVADMLEKEVDDDVLQKVIDMIGAEQVRWASTGNSSLPNTLVVQRPDGSRKLYEIRDTELFKLLAGINESSTGNNWALAAVGKVTRGMAALTTGSNPIFAVRNAARDFQSSVNYGSWASNYLSGAAKWAKAFYEVWRNSGDYQDYKALGGGGWTRIETNTKKGSAELRGALLKGYNTSNVGRTIKFAGQKVWNTITAARLNEVVEQTSRFVEYKYGKHDKSTQEGRVEAFLASQDVTGDFARSGNSQLAGMLKTLVPFFNASVQGVYRTGRALTEAESSRTPTRFAKTVVNTALMSLLTNGILLKFLGDDEKEEYALMSDELKSQHIYLPNFAPEILGQQPLIRIPLAQDPLTYAVHGMVSNAVWSGTTDEAVIELGAIANTILDNLNPIGSGSIFQPLIGIGQNKNWYGSRIVPTRLEKLDPSTQYTADTPDIFVAAGRELEMSPLKIQYLAEQYTGFLGQLLIPALSKDEITGELGGLPAAINAARKRLTSDPLISNDIVSSFYDGANFLTQVTEAVENDKPLNVLRRGLTPEEATAAYEEAKEMTSSSGIVGATKKQISALYDEIDAINANDTLTDEQKYELTSAKRREMIDLTLDAQEAIGAYKEKYATGVNLVTRMLEGAYAVIPTAYDKMDTTFKADEDQLYMQQALAVYEATGKDSALPHPLTEFEVKDKITGLPVVYEIGEDYWDGWTAEYKKYYQMKLAESVTVWDSLTADEQAQLLSSAHSYAHRKAKEWYADIHGIKLN